MDRLLVLSLLVAVLLGVAVAQKRGERIPEECLEECKEEECPKPVECEAGLTTDRCGCCKICAQTEGQLCDHPKVKSEKWLGNCGENLECKLRKDLKKKDERVAVCKCRLEETLCGTNNVTYETFCSLSESAARQSTPIKVQHKGPCHTAPRIVSPPEHQKNRTGTNVAMACEASGYPIPAIHWTWTRVDGMIVELPSDDTHISVNQRGGPEKYEVTGWCQIMDLEKTHEGDYTCIAQNENGVVKHSARVIVVDDPEETL